MITGARGLIGSRLVPHLQPRHELRLLSHRPVTDERRWDVAQARNDMRDRAMGTVVIAIGAGPPGRLNVGALAQAFGAPLAVGSSVAAAALVVAVITALLPEFRARQPDVDDSA